ncbi:MAG: hypothetical protein FJ006_04970 [Chloroflexi bacterium]|nr:hypothetical protein [Chloroflexota bacterium]
MDIGGVGRPSYSLGYRGKFGNKIPKTTWSNIFHNRFYLGETWLKRGDVPIKGNHEPLVDEVIFAQVQQILAEHDKHRQRIRRHKYLLKGLVYSVDAGSACWAETHPRKKASYYRSREEVDGAHIFYNTKDVESQIPDVIGAITIDDWARQDLRKELARWFDAEANEDGELKRAETRLAKLERVEKNLQRLAIEEEISFEDFKEHRTRIEAEKARLKNTVDAIKQRQHLVKADFEIALQLANELDFLFGKGNFDERRLLCETVFKRIYVEDGKITEVELNSSFSLIATKAKSSGTVLSGGADGIRTP